MFCKKCNTDKQESDFYPTQKSECKECTKIRVRSNRKANTDYYRAYDRKRGNRQSPTYLSEYRKNNPEKYKAHNAVNNAIRDGKLNKEPCMMCGEKKTVGHHVDYSKPLEVIWLCQGCHKSIHEYEDKVNEIKGAA